MEFEASMSNVSALSGATGNDLKILENKAREMGAKTSKSAKDAADAMGFMSLAGWKQKQIINGIEPVLRLAEAGNLDLARASSLTTDSLSAMGLTVKELPKYLDIVAQTARSSNTDIDQMMQAYIGVGGALKGLNVPAKESAIVLGMLANKGVKGGEAATALNAVITNLTAPTGRAEKALKALKFTAFDSKGKFKGLTNVLGELGKKTSGMTEKQRNMYLSMIGGKEHVKDLNALLTGMSTDYGKLKKQINGANGALNEMAKTMQDNNKGSITQLKSATEELGLKIYDILKPKIAKTVEILQTLTNKLNSLTPAQQQAVVKFAAIAAAIGPVLLIVGKMSTSISNVGFKIVGLITNIKKAGGVMAWLLTPGHIVVAVLVALAIGAVLVCKNWGKISKVIKKVGNDISKFTGISGKELKKFFKFVGTALGKGIKEIGKAVKSLKSKILPPLKSLIKTIGKTIKSLMPILRPILKFVVGVFVTGFILAFNTICTVVGAIVSTIGGILGGLIKRLHGVINFLVGAFSLNWSQCWEGIKQVFTGIIDTIKSVWKGLVSLLSAPIQAIVDILDSAFHSKIAKVKEAWNGIKTFLSHPITGTISLIKHGNLSGVKKDGSHAIGLNRVPFDGYMAELHEGERVLTKHETEQLERKSSTGINITIQNMTVREEGDIDKIANKIVQKLQIQRSNMPQGA